ncbi:hypothetical protein HOY82DRAFT_563149 [Tuber indicum]|nr:hypothetical protein HOY82DRAFT_563149 [Tuber indicum]
MWGKDWSGDDNNDSFTKNVVPWFQNVTEADYEAKWSLFCSNKAKDTIKLAERDPPSRRCQKCKPRKCRSFKAYGWSQNNRSAPRKGEEGCFGCRWKLFVEIPSEYGNLLGELEKVANGTAKTRGLKFRNRDQRNGAPGNGDLGGVIGILGAALGVGGVILGI